MTVHMENFFEKDAVYMGREGTNYKECIMSLIECSKNKNGEDVAVFVVYDEDDNANCDILMIGRERAMSILDRMVEVKVQRSLFPEGNILMYNESRSVIIEGMESEFEFEMDDIFVADDMLGYAVLFLNANGDIETMFQGVEQIVEGEEEESMYGGEGM